MIYINMRLAQSLELGSMLLDFPYFEGQPKMDGYSPPYAQHDPGSVAVDHTNMISACIADGKIANQMENYS